jgi:sortase (surface protein transpeptidase)
MDVPDNTRDVAWYRYGPRPGEPGSAVLAAHVDLAGQGRGVFFSLQSLEPGEVVVVTFDDGSAVRFRVEARVTYAKEELPLEVIFSREGPPVLTLVTCGGRFDRSASRYDSNVVVYAIPVDGPRPTLPPA